jgi:nitrate reductase delta subunit
MSTVIPTGSLLNRSRILRKKPKFKAVPEQADLFAIASLWLDYPQTELFTSTTDVRELLDELPFSRSQHDLIQFAHWLETQTLTGWQSEYVTTFDMRRRSTLYLTYYLYGDTRERGSALVELQARYRHCGLQLAKGELPDYLPAILQFTSSHPLVGSEILHQYHASIDLIGSALKEMNSPYYHVVMAVSHLIGGKQ